MRRAPAGLRLRSMTCRCSSGDGLSSGQSSIEAALLLPMVMFCCAFLLQPACVLYTRSIMRSAAAETARAAAVPPTGAKEEWYEAYAKRRLKAVPEASCFHVGGSDDWEVEVDGMGSHVVSVGIRGHVRPLPLLGIVVAAFGEQDGEGILLDVEVGERVRPEWLTGSYGSWASVWD